jgi:hypothetical protein
LNDKFFDIGDFQQFSADRIQPGSLQLIGTQAIDMGLIDMHDLPDLAYISQKLDFPRPES